MNKILRGLLSLLLIFCCIFAVCACDSPAAPTEENNGLEEPAELSTVCLNVAENLSSSDQSKKVFRTRNRTFVRNNGLACDLTCSGIAFNVLCKGEMRVKFTTDADVYFTVYIDGVRRQERLLVEKEKSGTFIAVAQFDSYGAREIAIIKQSQYPMALCEINEVEILGSFGQRPAQSERFLEFYGDSVLNGSNIYTGGTSVKTSDGTLAFGYLAALSLQADCNIVGRGGMGLYPKDTSTEGMNEIWDRCGTARGNGSPYYDFGRMPDAVVVELGNNDCLSDSYTDERYTQSIKEMVLNLRSVYGEDVKIIWCYGYLSLVNAKWGVAKKALDGLNENGSILYCPLPNCALSKEDGGDGYHPNVEMSADIAAALAEFIGENIYGDQ